MALLDTLDGALMMALYTSPSLAKDPIAILYYSIVLTVITVVVAIVIGTIQLLTLVSNVAQPSGRFWDGVEVVGNYWDVLGRDPSFQVFLRWIVPWFCLPVKGIVSAFRFRPFSRSIPLVFPFSHY